MILLTNDDGIGAPGLECARSFLEGLGEEVLVVAPRRPMSQCGHSITTDGPLALEEAGPGRWALHGTPADCARVGLTVLAGQWPRWVVSGVNAGANLGIDTYVSGTVAAAREAAALGARAVALSVYYREPIDLARDFDAAAMGEVWRWIENAGLGDGEFWNVNFPHPEGGVGVPDIVLCPVSRRPLPVAFARDGAALTYTGIFNAREREPGSDVEVCFGGRIAISRMRV